MNRARTDFIDELRGLSLLGIVLVNAPFLAISLNPHSSGVASGPINQIVEFLVAAFAQGRFYLIFSILFG